MSPIAPNHPPRPQSFSSEVQSVPLAALGELLVAVRKRQRWTQQRLAERLDSHQETITRWETSRYRSADLETLLRVAGALEVNIFLSLSDGTPHSPLDK